MLEAEFGMVSPHKKRWSVILTSGSVSSRIRMLIERLAQNRIMILAVRYLNKWTDGCS